MKYKQGELMPGRRRYSRNRMVENLEEALAKNKIFENIKRLLSHSIKQTKKYEIHSYETV